MLNYVTMAMCVAENEADGPAVVVCLDSLDTVSIRYRNRYDVKVSVKRDVFMEKFSLVLPDTDSQWHPYRKSVHPWPATVVAVALDVTVVTSRDDGYRMQNNGTVVHYRLSDADGSIDTLFNMELETFHREFVADWYVRGERNHQRPKAPVQEEDVVNTRLKVLTAMVEDLALNVHALLTPKLTVITVPETYPRTQLENLKRGAEAVIPKPYVIVREGIRIEPATEVTADEVLALPGVAATGEREKTS